MQGLLHPSHVSVVDEKDFLYPDLQFSPDGRAMFVTYLRSGVENVRIYDLAEKVWLRTEIPHMSFHYVRFLPCETNGKEATF